MNTPSLTWHPITDDVKHLLKLATDHWENTAESEKYIHQALNQAGDCLDVLVAAYRYFFYKSNYPLALKMATTICDRILLAEHLPQDWQQLAPILNRRKEDSVIRLYLNAYAASGFVLARLGAFEQAKEITARVSEIDAKEFGGSAVVLDVLTHPEQEDD
jgi:hypothetical protein